jgi:DNA modification methylase
MSTFVIKPDLPPKAKADLLERLKRMPAGSFIEQAEAAAEMVDPATLKPWPKNPRKNDGEPVEKVAESIKRFGFAAPIVARRETREIIAGHTRWKAATKLKLTEVPVRFLDIDEREAHLLALADNRLGELAEWDTPDLHALLASYDLGDQMVAGWNEKEMRELERAARNDGEIEDDEAPPLPVTPVTQPGDLWLLGKHRLVCGDATDPKAVALARAHLEPFLMVTDPPYGVEHDPHWREEAGVSSYGPQAKGLVANDDRRDWGAAYKLFPGRAAYVWHAGKYAGEVAAGLTKVGFEIRSQIIWKKPQIIFGRGHYHWQHEPCWYAARDGGPVKWSGDRKQSTIWEIKSLHVMGGARGTDENPITGHATQKPLECMARPMRNHGAIGDVVYDPFCGSGTALIAAEHLGRVCVALDVSAAYCDVIVERWQRLTGDKAQRQG